MLRDRAPVRFAAMVGRARRWEMPFHKDFSDDERDVREVNDVQRDIKLGLWDPWSAHPVVPVR